jgi:hypothetical protein
MNALIISLGPLARMPTFPDAEFLVDQGWTVTLLASFLPDDARIPPGVRVIELADAEAVALVNRGEKFLVQSFPRLALRLARRLFARAGRVRGIGRPARVAMRVTMAAQVRQPWFSTRVHRTWQRRPYRALRPFVLWRLIRRTGLPELLVAGTHLIVCADREVSIAVAWHLAKLLPDTPVCFGVDRERWPELPVQPAVLRAAS